MQRFAFAGAFILAFAGTCAFAGSKLPTCDAAALAAVKTIPAPQLACDDGGSTQICSSDKPLGADSPDCQAAAKSYEKILSSVLTAQWWSTPAESLEACRIHGKVGTLTKDENDSLNLGYGGIVQGTDRVRMLVLGQACDTAGMSNEFLVVRTDAGPAVTPLYYDFNQGGQEAPFSLDVASDADGTFALFTTVGHDMRDMYTSTTAYKIDPKTGDAALYPLFVTAKGPMTRIDQSQPVTGDVTTTDTAIVKEGRFVKHFNSYQSKSCPDDDSNCNPVKAESFRWNGNAFVVNGYETKHKEFMRKLAAQRECVKKKFDPKTGTAACDTPYDCENYNDLAFLSLKAGDPGRAKSNAEMALSSCIGNPKEYAAAQYNYRQSLQKSP